MTTAAPGLTPIVATSLVRALGDTVLQVSGSGRCLRVEGSAAPLSISAREALGRGVAEVVPNAIATTLMNAVHQSIDSGAPTLLHVDVAKGARLDRFEARVVRGDDRSAFVVFRDVGDRERAERQLRESEERFRVMADHAPVMLWKSDRTGECDFFNQRWLEFTGRSMEQEMGIGWAAGIHVEDFQRCVDIYMEAFVRRSSFRMEYRLQRADGAFRWILDQGTPRWAPEGSFEGFVGSCVDITDMKESQEKASRLTEALGQRLQDREALLRELHHRVKNNLQLVTSLQSLQSRQVPDEVKALFEESQVRVRSMALVHEHLCVSESMAEVDFLRYARELVATLVHAMANGAQVSLVVDGDDVALGVEQAIPCGLLLTELVTNSLKHAFRGRDRGRLEVLLRRATGQGVRLEVRDDGVGLPTSVTLERPRTLGFDLVHSLASQLGASVESGGGPGTWFEIGFQLAQREANDA